MPRDKRYLFDTARFIEIRAPHNASREELEERVNEEAMRMIESGDMVWVPLYDEEIN